MPLTDKITSRPALGFGIAGALVLVAALLVLGSAVDSSLVPTSTETGPVQKAVGPPGPPGPPGADGRDGQRGERGRTGKTGERGLTGRIGPPGPAGLNGSDGVPGRAGSPGDPGQAGESGPSGATGPPGKPGEEGKEGKRGLRGRPGPLCPPGYVTRRVEVVVVSPFELQVPALLCVGDVAVLDPSEGPVPED